MRQWGHTSDGTSIPSKIRVSKVPPECKKLRNKILKKYADVFKDKLEKGYRVNIPPVKLQIDVSRKIPPFTSTNRSMLAII